MRTKRGDDTDRKKYSIPSTTNACTRGDKWRWLRQLNPNRILRNLCSVIRTHTTNSKVREKIQRRRGMSYIQRRYMAPYKNDLSHLKTVYVAVQTYQATSVSSCPLYAKHPVHLTEGIAGARRILSVSDEYISITEPA